MSPRFVDAGTTIAADRWLGGSVQSEAGEDLSAAHPGDLDPLASAGLAADQAHGLPPQSERAREEIQQRRIGGLICRWCRDPHPE